MGTLETGKLWPFARMQPNLRISAVTGNPVLQNLQIDGESYNSYFLANNLSLALVNI